MGVQGCAVRAAKLPATGSFLRLVGDRGKGVKAVEGDVPAFATAVSASAFQRCGEKSLTGAVARFRLFKSRLQRFK